MNNDQPARAVDIVASTGAYNVTDPDVLRRLEDKINTWVIEESFPDDNPLLLEIRRLISRQIAGLELGSNYLVLGPNNKLFRVTK